MHSRPEEVSLDNAQVAALTVALEVIESLFHESCVALVFADPRGHIGVVPAPSRAKDVMAVLAAADWDTMLRLTQEWAV